MTHLILILQRSAWFINSLNECIGRAVSWLTLCMVLITFSIVILRYLFDTGWVAMQESVTYLHAQVFMLGAAYTLKNNGHVRVDIVYQRCNNKTRAWIDCIGSLFLLIPVVSFILWSSWEYVFDSWTILESSRNSGGLPAVFLLKTTIPIMAILLALQGLVIAFNSLLTALGYRNSTAATEPQHG